MNSYGLIGAGAVSRSFLFRLPDKARELGPIASTSSRVASRIANSLRAGTAAKSAHELARVPVVLFCSNAVSAGKLVEILLAANLNWAGRSIVLCDTDISLAPLRKQGAAVASISEIGIPGRFAVQGDAEAVKAARTIVRKLAGRAIVLESDGIELFHAGLTMGTALVTPLLDRLAQVFRKAGVRDKTAMELASAIVEKTAKSFGHSGRQSWLWHLQEPDPAKLSAEEAALRAKTGYADAFQMELIAALEALGRHDAILNRLKNLKSIRT